MNKLFKFLPALVLVCSIIGLTSSCKKKFDNPPFPSDPLILANTTIAQLKALHTVSGAIDVITDDIVVSGIVVANDKSGNFYKQLFVQDATGAIQLMLDASGLYGTYPVGRRIFIRCKDLSLTDYHGTMLLGKKIVISGSPSVEAIPGNTINSYVIGGSLNNPVVPLVVTQNMLTTNMQDPYLGALIQLNDYEFQSSDLTKTYADTTYYKNSVNLYVKNCAGGTPIIVRTSGYSNFAALRPAAGNGNIISIYTIYNTDKQLIIRDTSDVKFYGSRCSLFEEDFGSLTTAMNNGIFAFTGWKNLSEVGGVTYKNTVFGTSGKAVKVTAFGSGQPVVTSWLITPPISLAGTVTPKLNFTSAYQFANLATLNAYISTDYDGGNTPWAPTNHWILLTGGAGVIPANTANNNSNVYSALTSTGNLDLSTWAGQTVYIAFKYEGTTTKTTNMEIDDIKVLKQ